MDRAISVLSDVKTVSELLDGASVDQARLVSSGGRISLELELTRAMAEQRGPARRGLFRRAKTPWIKSRLTLHQIQDVTVQRLGDQAPEQTPLLMCEAIPGGYQVVVTSPDGLRLQLAVEQLSGQCQDFGSPIESP